MATMNISEMETGQDDQGEVNTRLLTLENKMDQVLRLLEAKK